MGVSSQRHAPTALPLGMPSAPLVQEDVWALGTIWTGAENLAPTGTRSPDCAPRSESL